MNRLAFPCSRKQSIEVMIAASLERSRPTSARAALARRSDCEKARVIAPRFGGQAVQPGG